LPEKLRNSDIKLKDVSIGTSALLQEAVEKQIDQLFYQRFDSTVEALSAFFTNTAIAHSSKDDVTELKATRDIYVHNAGIINGAYHRKAGPKARQADFHTKKLALDDSYLVNATESTISVCYCVL
jgi:hypothetical protein